MFLMFTIVGPLLNYAAMTFHGLPVLNMTYSGALKTAIYGLFLRWSGAEFSVLTWRALGIVIGGFSLAAFFLLIGRRVSALARGVLALLLLTDTSFLLLQRHDYGPVALGAFFRLLFVAVWLRQVLSSSEDWRHYFLLGCIAGLAGFEKMSSLVLLLPLLLSVAVGGPSGADRRIAAAGLGLLGGLLPLMAVNAYSMSQSGSLISLSEMQPADRSIGAFLHYLGSLLALGSGQRPRAFILGDPTTLASIWLEGLSLGLLLVVAFLVTAKRARADRLAWFGSLCVISYVLVGLGTWLLPGETDAHHWILATPFQYGAIAVAASLIASGTGGRWRMPMAALLVLFLGNRVLLLGTTATELARGHSSRAFDPSLTRLGEFVHDAGSHEAFIAADWGVTTPMFCLANGPTGRVFEPYWVYSGPTDLQRILTLPSKTAFYVVTLRPPSGVRPAQTQRLLDDIEERRDLIETAPESRVADLETVSVRKFVRRPKP